MERAESTKKRTNLHWRTQTKMPLWLQLPPSPGQNPWRPVACTRTPPNWFPVELMKTVLSFTQNAALFAPFCSNVALRVFILNIKTPLPVRSGGFSQNNQGCKTYLVLSRRRERQLKRQLVRSRDVASAQLTFSSLSLLHLVSAKIFWKCWIKIMIIPQID